MKLHDEIMSLPVGTPGWAGNDLLLYKEGHRDARHAAAELAAAQDALVDELVAALKECAARLEIHSKHSEDLVALMRADSAINSAEGAKS